MNESVDETELLTEVPEILKRLARVIVKSFYETEHTAVINLLVKHTCVKEEDLFELLKFDKKQLRTVLARLKSDKIIKQRVFREKQADTGNTITGNYFFIDYKLFVNVVKYKLDHIRNKIEHDEREATNRPSFVCKQCDKRYSDLEVDRLIDPTGNLTCEFCSGPIEEDLTDVQQKQNSRSLLALFNDQMEHVFVMLKHCENIKLAPEVLEPAPALSLKHIVQRTTSSSASTLKSGWSNKALSSENLYEQDIKINMGGEKVNEESKKLKETPLWIKESTVGPVLGDVASEISNSSDNATPVGAAQVANHDIMKDLLAHESVSKKPRLEENVKSLHEESSDESEGEFSNVVETSSNKREESSSMVKNMDDSEDDEFTVKIGGKEIPLDDITDEMIEKMTPEEHEAYTKAYQEAFSHLY